MSSTSDFDLVEWASNLAEDPTTRLSMRIGDLQAACKNWINWNLHDGEDRSCAHCDKHYFTAPELYEMVEEMLTDVMFEDIYKSV